MVPFKRKYAHVCVIIRKNIMVKLRGQYYPWFVWYMNDLSIYSIILVIWAHATFFSVSVPSQESDRSCICVLVESISTFLILDFGTLSAWTIAVEVQYKTIIRRDEKTNNNQCISWHLSEKKDSIPRNFLNTLTYELNIHGFYLYLIQINYDWLMFNVKWAVFQLFTFANNKLNL